MATEAPIRLFSTTCRSCLRLSSPSRPQRPRLLPTTASSNSRSLRPISSTRALAQDADTDAADRPRWQRTPPAMAMPVRSRPRPKGPELKINDDPRKLDQMYTALLGDQSPTAKLSEEVKWLAVTHKSFDHGRRGFNDRLAFLGKRIVDLQLSMALLNAPKVPSPPQTHDVLGRALYNHPALDTLDNLTNYTKTQAVDKKRLAQLAEEYGLPAVIRWKPRQVNNLAGAGIDSVLAQTMYAIVGALALEKGGSIANRIVKDRILRPLGL